MDYLIISGSGTYVDCTLGGAGHAELILQKLQGNGMLVGIDADPDALVFSREKLKKYSNVRILRGFFDQLDALLMQENLLPAEGVLMDLGISSFQIDAAEKGFSFQSEGQLDMRFNPDQELSAEKIVNTYSAEALEEIFRLYGEEKNSRRISQRIVQERDSGAIRSTRQLAEVIKKVVPVNYQVKSLARIFQAIRIEVNQELERLKTGLEKAFQSLTKNGRLVVISYHSLEDRIVKEFFRYKEKDCVCPPEFPKCICDKVSEIRIITKKPVTPSSDEINKNPRSRSAKLRVAEKISEYVEL
ncbi:MAG: 16S rRNA (cytosine(1402)-N(4))-methyltransferase RsmH [bacterium]|nr:MAG: 16S rRNA (cytosine(1402)-N(4))-methyltransferase RsmH [bacterium]